MDKDFLIISYNEGNENFVANDCDEIIEKINRTKPLLIFVCTQESTACNDRHYQHILGLILDNNLSSYKILMTMSAIQPGFFSLITKIACKNKNVRTRVYYDITRVKTNINKPIKSSIKNIPIIENIPIIKNIPIIENISYKNNTNNKIEYKISEVGCKYSKNSGLGYSTSSTLYKGSILTRLVLKKNHDTLYKFIVVNSHLYYDVEENTGIEQRKDEFNDLLDEFKLNDFFNEGYNVFFCGDLNFRLTHKRTDKLSKNELAIKIIEKFGNKSYNEQTNENNFKNYNNELYKLINEKKQNNNLLLKFKENMDKFGIHLTCKFNPKSSILYSENLRCSSYVNKTRGQFDCLPKKNKKFRMPSMCDKILVANHDEIIIKPNDFKLMKELKKSDHCMITLTGNFKKENSKSE